MRKKWLLPALMSGSLLFATMPGHAAASGSDAAGDTIEPILVKSDVQPGMAGTPFRTTNINEGNIKSFSVTAVGGVLKATVETVANLPQTPLQAAQIAPPYGGVHVMVHFQTSNMREPTDTGCISPPSLVGACAPGSPVNNTSKWVPMFHEDREYIGLGYGVVANETDNDSFAFRYDPSGRLVAVPVGQVWSIQGQRTSGGCDLADVDGPGPYDPADQGPLPAGRGNSTSIAFPAANKVEISTPYLYRFRTAAPAPNGCLSRQKQLINVGETVNNAVAFSWADHCICAPDPVGLILGWTWYLDSVPGIRNAPGVSTTGWGYQVGTPSGDPNPAAFLGPNCPVFVRGQQVNPLYPPAGAPCMIANPIGPGFQKSGLNSAPAT